MIVAVHFACSLKTGHLMQVMMRHKKTHDKFAKMAARISMAEPPCMSNAEDWESQNGWVDEMGPLPEPDIGPPILPDGTTSEHLPVDCLS